MKITIIVLNITGCERGSYWENCTRTCPGNCLNDACDIFSGNCYLCDNGYKGSMCDGGICSFLYSF